MRGYPRNVTPPACHAPVFLSERENVVEKTDTERRIEAVCWGLCIVALTSYAGHIASTECARAELSWRAVLLTALNVESSSDSTPTPSSAPSVAPTPGASAQVSALQSACRYLKPVPCLKVPAVVVDLSILPRHICGWHGCMTARVDPNLPLPNCLVAQPSSAQPQPPASPSPALAQPQPSPAQPS